MYNVLRNVTTSMDTRRKGRLWGVERRTTLKARGLRWFGSNEIMGKKGVMGIMGAMGRELEQMRFWIRFKNYRKRNISVI